MSKELYNFMKGLIKMGKIGLVPTGAQCTGVIGPTGSTGPIGKTRAIILLEELVNMPSIKRPLWIEGHREELEKYGIDIRETK